LARIPDEVNPEIRDRVDIVAVLGEHMTLKKAGNSWKGLCPFHGEKTPSFNVSQAKRSYYCFGCQRSGDVFKFVSEIAGKSFVEVVRELAGRVGVTIPEREQSAQELRARDERGRFLDLNMSASAFYRERLADELGGRKGRDYLEQRGIGAAVSERFQLGLAPDAWDALARHLELRKVPVESALALGLVAPRTGGRGGYYDKFRDRLMCPVLLPAGEVVGFSGRTLGNDPETPKYVNSSESPIYKKSQLLFGVHAARPAFRARNRALLVEGNFDVIALHQAGFEETIAPLGTALTEDQVEKLHRLTQRVVLCLDGDKAGRAATLKAIPMCLAAGLETLVVALPDGEDPDSFVRKHGKEALEALITGARPAVDFFLDQVWYGTARSADARAEALKQVVPLVVGVRDEVKRMVIVDQFARALDVSTQVVQRAVAAGMRDLRAPLAPVQPSEKVVPPPDRELKLLAILADHPDLMAVAEEMGVGSALTDVRLRSMYYAVLAGAMTFVDALPADIGSIVASEIFAERFKTVEDPRRTLANALANIRQGRGVRDITTLTEQIKDAQRRGDTALVRELMAQLTSAAVAKS
jgi:DNA primase